MEAVFIEIVERQTEVGDTLQFFRAHCLHKGELVGARVGESHFGVKEVLVVFEASVALAHPVAVRIGEQELQRVAVEVASWVFRIHEQVQVLCFVVDAVADVHIDGVVLHRVVDVECKVECVVQRPCLAFHGQDFFIEDTPPAGRGRQQQSGKKKWKTLSHHYLSSMFLSSSML